MAGGLACIVAALGLLSASYLSLMVPWSAVEYGVCKQVSFAIEPRAPCQVAAVAVAGGGTRGGAVAEGAVNQREEELGGGDDAVEAEAVAQVEEGLGSALDDTAADDVDVSCHRLRLQVSPAPCQRCAASRIRAH